ncbi:hypothetical protein ACTXT7_003715 [Hymenolepis weldensis]
MTVIFLVSESRNLPPKFTCSIGQLFFGALDGLFAMTGPKLANTVRRGVPNKPNETNKMKLQKNNKKWLRLTTVFVYILEPMHRFSSY